MLRTKTLLNTLSLLFIAQFALAQGQGNTPYSIFGYGELADVTATTQEMMGGTGASYSNAFYVNLVNPALLVKNRVASGLKYVAFNVGIRGNSRNISTTGQSQYDLGLNLNHLSLTVPVSANWATALVLRPYSMVDHKSIYTEDIIGTNNQTITHENASTGGISRISFANSFRIKNKLYLGLELASNFGTISKDSSTYLFGDISDQLRNSSRYTVNGTSVKIGVAFQQRINDDWQINFGASSELSGELKGDKLSTFATYSDAGNGSFLTSLPDTLAFSSINATTPAQHRVGISLESPFHWVFAADYHTTKWSGHTSFDEFGQKHLADTQELKFGMEWLPSSSSTQYFNQIFYRLGYARAESPYIINNTRIKDNKFSFGMSMPMGFRNPSYLNLGVAIGRRGTLENNLVRENYVRFSASMSLLNPWFIKPRID